jgi:hypothetical protein
VRKHGHIHCNFFLIHQLLLIINVLTITNTLSAVYFDLQLNRINLETVGTMATFCCAEDSESLTPLFSSISDSLSAPQSSSLLFWLFKFPFQSSQLLVSEMLSSTLSWSLLTRRWSSCVIQWILNTWVRTPGRSSVDNTDGTSDLSDNWNAATPSWWKFDQVILTISSWSEMYPTAVISLFPVRVSVCIACRVGLPYQISNKSWTLAMMCNFFCCSSLFIFKSLSRFVVSNAGSLLANNKLLA